MLYGLKQAPRAWYDCLKDFLLKQGFEIGKANATLFTHKVNNDIFVYQMYVDDIIFGSTNVTFCEEFSRIMTNMFEMSMMGEFSWISNEATQGWHIHKSNHVHQRRVEEV